MNTTTSTPISLPLPLSLPADLPSTAGHALRHLQRLQHGTLHLELPDGQKFFLRNFPSKY